MKMKNKFGVKGTPESVGKVKGQMAKDESKEVTKATGSTCEGCEKDATDSKKHKGWDSKKK